MSEENTGVTEENVASSHTDKEINWQKANETMSEQKKEIESLRQEKSRMEQQQQLYQAYLQSAYTPQSQQGQPAQEEDPWAEIPDEDVPMGSNIKKAFGKVLSKEKQQFNETVGQLRAELNSLKLQSSHSDYKDVVMYGLKAAQADPNLANAMASSSNPALLAYQLGKAHPEYQEKQWNQKQSDEAKRIVENSQLPGSANRAATGGSPLSKTNFFMDCSDEDFEKHIAKIKYGA